MSTQHMHQVYTFPIPDTTEVPGNCGILVNEHKHMGKRSPVQKGETVIVVDPDTREIHTWNRTAYHRWILGDDESPSHAWQQSRGVGRRFATSKKMVVCSNELKNNGVCDLRWDEDHNNHHYHFTKRHFNGKPYYTQKWIYPDNATPYDILKPVCRYSLTDDAHLCWERHNAEHNRVFAHE